MSCEDLWKDDSILPMLFVIFLIGFLIITISLLVKKISEEGYYSDIPITKKDNVTVVSKLQTPIPMSPTVMTYSIAFETEQGNRIQLKVKDSYQFNSLIEGDFGELSYKDDMFVGFTRKNKNI